MSDYLNNLLARTVSPNVGVRPRVPSIFEPQDSIVRENQPELESDVPAWTTSSALTNKTMPGSHGKIEPATEATPPSGLPQNLKKKFIPVSASMDLASEAETDVNLKPKSMPSPNTDLKQPPIEIELPQAQRSPVVVPVIRPTPAAKENESPVQKPIGPNEFFASAGRNRISNQNAPATPALARRAKNTDAAPVEIVTPPVRPAREANSFSTPVFPRRDAAHLPTNSVSAPSPTIQVTIGRLEVRATAPAANLPRAKTKKEPAMSLDTYLQRRAEGGRR